MARTDRSEFGAHLVFVTARDEGQVPTFEEVRAQLTEEWQREQEANARNAYFAALLEKYDVQATAQCPAPARSRAVAAQGRRSSEAHARVPARAVPGFVLPALAHEVRPAYLELRESASGELDVLWKTPMIGDMRLSLAPILSGASEETHAARDAAHRRRGSSDLATATAWNRCAAARCMSTGSPRR